MKEVERLHFKQFIIELASIIEIISFWISPLLGHFVWTGETCICCETTFSPSATTTEPFFATWQKNPAVAKRIFTQFTINSIYVHSIIRFRKTCFLLDLVRRRLISEHFCHEYHDLVRGSVWNSLRFKLYIVIKRWQRTWKEISS